MAAIAGPEFMADSASVSGLGSSPRLDILAANTNSGDDSSMTSPLPSPRLQSPPPNPPFVFPAKAAPSSAPSSYSRATGRRPRSAIEPQERPAQLADSSESRPRRSPQLPDFSFNPAATLPSNAESAFLSPPQSPQSPRAIPARPAGAGHGHRRGGSEFVGGKMRDGDAIAVMSTSPTKSEGSLASPVLAPSHPARGHRHKRSAAISSHDLSFMKIPPPIAASNARAGSAPTSPAVFDRVEGFTFPAAAPNVVKTAEAPTPEPESAVEQDPPRNLETDESAKASPKAIPRARVGFSDTLEFIPRPLSLVSSDTSSTATARPGSHSVSGSISSLISITTSTVADREAGPSSDSHALSKQPDSRPSTAGAVLERTQSIQELEPPASSPRRRNSIPLLTGLPPPGLTSAASPVTPSPTKTPKRWSFFGLEPPFVGASSPTRSRPVSSSSSEPQPLTPAEAVPPPVQNDPSAAVVVAEIPAGVKPSRKRSKKQKQVKKWAGSILSRKSKRHVKHKRRAPTPPLQRGPLNADEEEDEEDVDIESAALPTLLVTASDREGAIQRPVSAPDEDSAHAIIDLDAALGPFNTPLPRNLEWEAAQKAGGFVKKQLHSAAGMRGFSGPGMHYHRRAESAPEMQPFEGRFVRPFASSSTMADVFEEDEEDDDGETKSTRDSTPLAATPVEKKDDPIASQGGTSTRRGSLGSNYSATDRAGLAATGLKRKGSDLSEDGKPQGPFRMKSEHSSNSLQEEVIAEEFLDRALPPISPNHGADVDLPTPSPKTSSFPRGRDLAPVQVSPPHLPNHSLGPSSPYSMTQSSIAQSPRSPMSPYDTHRISTAPSSITGDNTFESLLRGEPGPEVRVSMDIPSLASSNSTMTRDSIFVPNPQLRQPPLGDHPRPSSLTSAAFGRRRSSLASLSRLISSSHGERSKLSMEVPMEPDSEKKPKASKTKRLGRMMQFWRPKEQES